MIEDKALSEQPKTFGVPPCSVLRPTLFLAYINNLLKHVCCSIGVFADNTLVYQIVDNKTGKLNFQKSTNALHAWANTWGMSMSENAV